ncbi:MAG: hypothetical protein N2111_14490 [Candidatus Sumerlaeaceae bacterium]|nr:hypothetical protein [Candidatus Sumerlaeaceae bacterium]
MMTLQQAREEAFARWGDSGFARYESGRRLGCSVGFEVRNANGVVVAEVFTSAESFEVAFMHMRDVGRWQ